MDGTSLRDVCLSNWLAARIYAIFARFYRPRGGRIPTRRDRNNDDNGKQCHSQAATAAAHCQQSGQI